jgi:hypothetical protein
MSAELLDSILLFRGIERMLVVLGGIASILVGAVLYKWGVAGEASLKLERDQVKFQLINASPGIFFALFGAAILVWSLVQPFSYKVASGPASHTSERGDVEIVYAQSVERLEGFLQKVAGVDPTLDKPLLRRQLENLKAEAGQLLNSSAEHR